VFWRLIMDWNNVISTVYSLVIIAMAVSVISLTVTKTKVFKPMRLWIKSKSEFFGELFSCPYCFSFYPSVLFIILYAGKLRLIYHFDGYLSCIDYGISYLCMVCIASFFTGFIYRSISQIE